MTTLIPKFDLKNGGITPTGAVNRAINLKLAETASVKDFGAVGDGVTDDLSAFVNALAAAKSVFIPAGTYYLSDTLTVTENILYGEGQGVFYNDASTRLIFAAGKSGLNLTGGSACQIMNFCVYSQSTVAGSDIGIRVASHGSVVENMLVGNFGSHGVYVTSSTGENANNCYLRTIRAIFNRGDGFRIGGGADQNACTFDTCDASSNTGVGFNSIASNTLFNHCHAATNGTDFQESGGSNIFMLPYSESGNLNVSNATPTGSLIIQGAFGKATITGNINNISQIFLSPYDGAGFWVSPILWTNGGAGLYGFASTLAGGFELINKYDSSGATVNRVLKQWNLNTTEERNRAAIYSDIGFGAVESVNGKQGAVTLVGGTATISNTSITANSRIFLTSQVDGGTPGFLRVSSRVVGTSFTITSSSGTDTSTVAYEIFQPGVASGSAV